MGCFEIPGDAQLSPDGKTLLLTSGGKRLAQRLRIGIGTILGTYKYDLSKGVPWFLLLEKPNRALLDAGLRDYFLSHSEVASIVSLEFPVDPRTRVMSVSYKLKMRTGETVESTSSIVPLK